MGTEDITATQSFSRVCATSTNMSSISGPSKGAGASVIYVARCPSSGPGRISRVDFAANTSVDIATFPTKDAQIYFTDSGPDFAVWQVLTTKTSGFARRIERKIGLWDKALPTPPARDMRTLFPQGYDDGTTGWVDWTVYAGAGRVLAGWASQYQSRQLGLVSLTTGAPVWTASGTIPSKRSDVRGTADRKTFLVGTEGGPYVVDVAASATGGATVRALDQKLFSDTQAYDPTGNYPALDPKRVLMQSASTSDFGMPTWNTVDLATGVRTELGVATGYAGPLGEASGTAMLASDGTPSAIVATAGGASLELRVATPGGVLSGGTLPKDAKRVAYVAPKGAFVVVEESLVPVPDPNPWERNRNARYWVARPGSNAPPVALEGGAVVSRARGMASPQERADGVNLFFYGLDSAWRLVALDAAGATTTSVIVPGRSLTPLQPGRALVDACVVDLTGPAPVPQANGCIEGIERPNTWPWFAREGARVFALPQGRDLRVFRY